MVDRNCSYTKLVNNVVNEFGLDQSKVAVTLKYELSSDLPLVLIKNDSNVNSYLVLKSLNCDPSKYPLTIEVTVVEGQEKPFELPADIRTSEDMFLLVDMSYEICEAAIENVGRIYKSDVAMVNVADGMTVSPTNQTIFLFVVIARHLLLIWNNVCAHAGHFK
ncbi:Hypothetical predicted protein [Olea europaea subsp. europaea]|uniref:Uncharacterized protein n=1 Tax=Olea europaea subsp. europaea TaxID=158383 RepID=A0A8S0USM0_OLEEU|nr:Hypothetical predicted protein [Olea europaea subsp. europaea]